MASVIERYLSLSPGEQNLVRSACAAPNPIKALGMRRLYFYPRLTEADIQLLKEYLAAHKPPA